MNIERIEEQTGMKVEVAVVTKTNGVRYEGIRIIDVHSNLSPVMYRPKGFSDTEFEDWVIKNYKQYMNPGFDLGIISSKERIFETVIPVLINTKRNAEMLETTWPHKKFKDLSVIYKVPISEDSVITVTYDVMKYAGFDLRELHKAAINNLKPVIMDIADVLRETGVPTTSGMMYVLSNDRKTNGAGCMLSNRTLQDLWEHIGDYYIIPSSIHEVLCVPGLNDNIDYVKGIKNMMYEVNRSEVPESDFLSDNLYKYDGIGLTIVK